MRARLCAVWAASKGGAISFATLFTIALLGVGAYEAAAGHLNILELLMVPVMGPVLFVVVLLFSFPITIPVSFIVARVRIRFCVSFRGSIQKRLASLVF
jgi:hypothetical protein